MTDIEEIAAGLSEAQRNNILQGVFSDQLASKGLCWFRAADIDFDAEPRPKTRPARWEWREKGEAVRAHLLKDKT